MSPSIRAVDNFLPPAEHQAVWAFLRGPGWSFGASSSESGQRYLYKHFAGFHVSGQEDRDLALIERELEAFPLIEQVWKRLKATVFASQALGRCYANGMPPGAEGALHLDSNLPDHITAIYYPHLTWDPDLAGETIFYNEARDEVLGAVYPKPNRLVVFPGVIPHVARPVSVRATEMRITLMFKSVGSVGRSIGPD
jgi:SM-20-related protein